VSALYFCIGSRFEGGRKGRPYMAGALILGVVYFVIFVFQIVNIHPGSTPLTIDPSVGATLAVALLGTPSPGNWVRCLS
jgi:hypothetical protein